MKKLFVVVVAIVLIASVIRSNAFSIGDRITRFFVTHSTVLNKNIVEYNVTSVGGDIYNVGIDTMGTVDTTDDVVVWTIKK